jgi:hypothetical protein
LSRVFRSRFAGLRLVDPEALHASRARVEWRPSPAMFDDVVTEFLD